MTEVVVKKEELATQELDTERNTANNSTGNLIEDMENYDQIDWLDMGKEDNNDAFVSIGGNGNFYFNVDTMDIFKEKMNYSDIKWLKIGFDHDNNLLFFKPLFQPQEESFDIPEHKDQESSLNINSSFLMKKIKSELPQTYGKKRYNAFWDNANYAMVVDLNERAS
jgi:hypothetical protein